MREGKQRAIDIDDDSDVEPVPVKSRQPVIIDLDSTDDETPPTKLGSSSVTRKVIELSSDEGEPFAWEDDEGKYSLNLPIVFVHADLLA